jgi:formylmethanofuran dehydrogenase subunit E
VSQPTSAKCGKCGEDTPVGELRRTDSGIMCGPCFDETEEGEREWEEAWEGEGD